MAQFMREQSHRKVDQSTSRTQCVSVQSHSVLNRVECRRCVRGVAVASRMEVAYDCVKIQ